MSVCYLNEESITSIISTLTYSNVIWVIVGCYERNKFFYRSETCLTNLLSVISLYMNKAISFACIGILETLAQFYRSGGKTSVLRYLSECCSSVRRDNERLSVLVTFLSFRFNTSFLLLFCGNPLCLFLLCLNASLLLFLSTFTLLSGFSFRLRLLGRYALRFRFGGFLSA